MSSKTHQDLMKTIVGVSMIVFFSYGSMIPSLAPIGISPVFLFFIFSLLILLSEILHYGLNRLKKREANFIDCISPLIILIVSTIALVIFFHVKNAGELYVKKIADEINLLCNKNHNCPSKNQIEANGLLNFKIQLSEFNLTYSQNQSIFTICTQYGLDTDFCLSGGINKTVSYGKFP